MPDMATPNASSLTIEFEDIIPKNHSSEPLEPEDTNSETAQPDNIHPEDLGPENCKSGQEKEDSLRLSTIPISLQPSPIGVTEANWQSTLDSLLRFPGMISNMSLFTPGSPMPEIAFALGVTDPNYTITENSWVPVAERVFEIQTCCMMQAKHIDLDVAPNGWVSWDITAEWCALVLSELQGKGFHTSCAALVPFVLRAYLKTGSWLIHQYPKGTKVHKQLMKGLKPDPDTKMVKLCSRMAKNFTNVVKQFRKRKVEMLRELDAQREP